MPTYEYRCDKGHTFEVVQRMSDDPVATCEVCGRPVQRVLHPVAVHFKGSGFYNTDYGTRKRQRENASSSDGAGSDSGAGDAKSGDSKSSDGAQSDKSPAPSTATKSDGAASGSKASSDSGGSSANGTRGGDSAKRRTTGRSKS
jgi:putative FmdB family regulatory protein